MESSAISLYFSLMRRPAPDAEPVRQENLINLIDSPGHIDFSSEVSTASRLCDGAVVLVDAVEGVCSQTVTVLRQTWVEKLKPLLVINKMDRLVTELKMSPGEAYTHLSKLLEQVNAVMGSFFQGERMEDDLKWREKMDERISAKAKERADTTDGSEVPTEATADYEEKDDEDIYFAPEKNNVIFSSAIDGWAFTVKQFAALYERKLGIKRSVLEKVLWGDFYLDPKTKKVLGSKHLKGRALKPIFVQLVLEQVWAVYEATTGANKGKGCVDFLFSSLTHADCIVTCSAIRSLSFHRMQRPRFGGEDYERIESHSSPSPSSLARSANPPHGHLCRMASVIDRCARVSHRVSTIPSGCTGRSHEGACQGISWGRSRCPRGAGCHGEFQEREGSTSRRLCQ